MSENATKKNSSSQSFNSLQLNIVTVVDVRKALAGGTLDNALYMMDNSPSRQGQGTAALQTACKPGQIVNWIIYPMDAQRQPNGAWPPMPKIENIVFLENDKGDTANVAQYKVCTEFKIYGGPDEIRSRSPSTPVYYYWAGATLSSLNPGTYYYRFVLALEQENGQGSIHLNSGGKSSLKVTPI